MLTKLRTLLGYHVQAALGSFRTLYRKPFATVMTVLVIAITLVLPMLFWVMSDNLNQLLVNWQRGGSISLYLKSPLSPAVEASVLARIKKLPGVEKVTLTSSAEGLLALQQQEGMQDMMRFLPENPLPVLIDVTPTQQVRYSEQLNQLYLQLKAYPEVDQAMLDIQWVNRLRAILGFITSFAHGLMLLLALAVVLIIGNTLRLAISNRHEEIQVLKLVGARDAYILRPFLYSGIWYGLAGALMAVLLVNLFMQSLTSVVNQLAGTYQMHYSLVGLTFRQAGLLVLSAITLGWLGASLSVRKQLLAIEPV